MRGERNLLDKVAKLEMALDVAREGLEEIANNPYTDAQNHAEWTLYCIDATTAMKPPKRTTKV